MVSQVTQDQSRNGIGPQPLLFTKVSDYTLFDAEYAVEGDDLIFHFFVTDEVNKMENAKKYWLEVFPRVLELSAISYFDAKFPRLKAAYTEENASWWMRFYGSSALDPAGFAEGFFPKLDEGLELALKNT